MKKLGQFFIATALVFMSFTTFAKAENYNFSVVYCVDNEDGIDVRVYNNLFGNFCIYNQTLAPSTNWRIATFNVYDPYLPDTSLEYYEVIISFEYNGYFHVYYYNLSDIIGETIEITPPEDWNPWPWILF